MADRTILVVGTYDTKSPELAYMADRIRALGGGALAMDMSVLGDPDIPVDYSKHDVARAGGGSIREAVDSGHENAAMQIMASGAAALSAELYARGEFHGVVILGGTMGTDAALDICRALPLGVPKYVVSTISFSPLIPPGRLSADVQMILWAGGLYGLNSVCKATLSQAAGAVLGAARAAEAPAGDRPVVGMTSLGSASMKYMTALKPALEARGYEVAIFHATGMGGMAFESIASQGGFCCVMDFALVELGNLMMGSVVKAGEDRLLGAGRAGTPQIVAPGYLNLVHIPTWQDPPPQFADRPFHTHNRLVKSGLLDEAERREIAREVGRRLGESTGPAHFILPRRGIVEWDRPGYEAHDPDGMAAFADELRISVAAPVRMTELDCHINDPEFAAAALEIFDRWVADGTIG
ncbi:MAG: Tm-1-like ATP-binding domain-containing protein [Defluviicoccus sp.]|nr:Tm-1-like ATP-binding domain-containing protein [Defluviicoccus sp.]MDE0382589.1 Tm-1-like ATP-binding domain-containing protein [Defluviicoccus sp.]